MTSEQRERMNELCRKMQVEQDPKKLIALAEELNQLLAPKEERKSTRTGEDEIEASS